MSFRDAFVGGFLLSLMLLGAGVAIYLVHGPESAVIACLTIFGTLTTALAGYVVRVLGANPSVGSTNVVASVKPHAVEQSVIDQNGSGPSK